MHGGGVKPPPVSQNNSKRKPIMKKGKIFIVTATAIALGASVLVGCGGDNNNLETPCAHTSLQKVDGKDATCFDYGNYAYYKCDGCGELFSDKNGSNPTTLDDVTIEKTRHDMHKYEEPAAGYDEYYFCNICGRYYEDLGGENQIPYDEFTDSSVTPEELPNGWADPDRENSQNRNFTIRCFIGWTSDGGFESFPNEGTVWVNVNLNRKITLSGTGWYNFGVAYNKEGLQYKDFGVGHLTKVSPEFTALFVRQNGIWVRIVRDGTNCSFYFEDKYGIPILISTNADFGADEALYRFAYGVPDNGTVHGYTLAGAKAEVTAPGWN